MKCFGGILEKRRNHSACIKDNLLIIIGGIRVFETYFCYIVTINLESSRIKNYEY